jgi:hypothetical protein
MVGGAVDPPIDETMVAEAITPMLQNVTFCYSYTGAAET